MADPILEEISDQTSYTTPVGADIIPVQKNADGVLYKTALSVIWQYAFNYIATLTADTSPDLTADSVGDYDNSAASGKRVLLSAIMPKGHLYGLTLANGTDATNDIDIATGSCIDSTNVTSMILASALTKQLDAAWAVGTNAGGLDTGSIANATYHVWLIKRSDTGVVDALFSTSASAPTMPASYDFKRRIGSIIRSGAAIVGFVQDGDKFVRKVPIRSSSVTNQATTASSITLDVPTGIRLDAIIVASMYDATSTAQVNWLITDLSQTDTAASATVLSMYTILITSGSPAFSFLGANILTNTSSQIRSRVDTQLADLVLNIFVHGWYDTRGRI